MDIYTLQRLYPNLQFSSFLGRKSIPTLNLNQQKRQEAPKIEKSTPSEQIEKKVIEEPKIEITEKIEEKKEEVKVDEPEVKQEVEPTQEPVKPAPKQHDKRIVYPKKGQRGIQKRITEEERKDEYLKKLSRLAIKTAEKRVKEVEEVLDRNDHKKENIKKEELELKKKLKLINTAYLFGKTEEDEKNINDNNIDGQTDEAS